MPKVKDQSYHRNYSEADLKKALQAIEQGQPLREVARHFKIPRATLQFRKNHKDVKSKFGPVPVLTDQEESTLVSWITESFRKGFPRRKLDIQSSVKEFLDKAPRTNPFPNNLPGVGWYRAFLRRHPELTLRTSEAVTSASSHVSEAVIRKRFGEIHAYLSSKNLLDILEDPSRVLNGDETNFNLSPKNSKVLAPKGAQNIYEIENAPSKSTVTVMFTFTAAGTVTPPMVIFPYKRLPGAVLSSIPEGWGVGLSESGWMRSEVFYEYISNVLYPALKKFHTKFPVVLFIDGHSSHLTYKVSELCSRLEIVLVCLYPNATRILQPADVSCFKPMKDGWRRAVLDWRRNNPLTTVTKGHFAPILKVVVDKYIKKESIINGFRACGLYPWNPNAVDFSKCLGTRNGPTNVENSNISKTISNESILTLTKFKEVIGKEKVKELEEVNDIQEEICSEDFTILYKLYTAFEKTAQENPNQPININAENSILEGSSQELSEINLSFTDDFYDIENMQVIFANNVNMETNINAKDLEYAAQNISENIEGGNVNTVASLNNDDESRLDNINLQNNKNVQAEDKLENISIENILQWPVTPQRKGVKETERLPFVLTSTQWKKIKTDKEDVKKNKEKEKEERKRTKAEKLKVQQKKTKDADKKKTHGKNTSLVKTETVTKDSDESKGVPESYFKELSKIDDRYSSHSDEDTPWLPDKEKILRVKRTIIGTRNVPKIRILSDIKITKSASGDEDIDTRIKAIELDPLKNTVLFKSLCFSCANNLTVYNFGIKCQFCIRVFHLNCIIKHKLHNSTGDMFKCPTCLKKNM